MLDRTFSEVRDRMDTWLARESDLKDLTQLLQTFIDSHSDSGAALIIAQSYMLGYARGKTSRT